MFTSVRRRRHAHLDIWPGFVDALSALLMVIIFVLLAFVLSQLYLSYALSKREADAEVQNARISELLSKLQAAQASKEKVDADLQTLQKTHDTIKSQLTTISQALSQEQEAHTKQRQDNATLTESLAQRAKEFGALQEEAAAFKVEIDKFKEKERLANSGFSQFRSEFLAKLQKIVGNRSDIRIVGDRFVFQSEVFFDQASADLGAEGKKQLNQLAKALKEIASKIPPEINWILRVDGHTDKRPIKNVKFRSNWELSAARALSVVHYLISQGLAPEHLVAAGFGEFQPLVKETTDKKELARNRRIEFKLDQR